MGRSWYSGGSLKSAADGEEVAAVEVVETGGAVTDAPHAIAANRDRTSKTTAKGERIAASEVLGDELGIEAIALFILAVPAHRADPATEHRVRRVAGVLGRLPARRECPCRHGDRSGVVLREGARAVRPGRALLDRGVENEHPPALVVELYAVAIERV